MWTKLNAWWQERVEAREARFLGSYDTDIKDQLCLEYFGSACVLALAVVFGAYGKWLGMGVALLTAVALYVVACLDLKVYRRRLARRSDV